MKKLLLGILSALLLFSALLPAALAAEEPQETGTVPPEEPETPVSDERFDDKSWEDVTRDFIKSANAREDAVTIGYYNTVTGEEYYIRGDEYMISGSMYKVPINMIYTDKISRGEMDWSTKIHQIAYEKLLEGTIVNSDNTMAETLWDGLGGYQKYREILAPYMGEDPETVDQMFYKNNYFTARQMIYCLRLLYENPERFPRVLDTMKRAEPKRFFNHHQQPVEIAHKFGYYVDEANNKLVENDCAVCFTEDPICLVVFTYGLSKPDDFLSDYCTLMIEYTEYQTALRHAEEQRKNREEAMNALQEIEAQRQAEAPTLTPTPEEQMTEALNEQVKETRRDATMLIAVLVLVALLAASFAILGLGKKKKLRAGWALSAAALCAVALLLGVFAMRLKPVVVGGTEGDPRETVTSFFDAVTAGDYPRAYACLNDYVTLGLENDPESEGARLLAQALRESYAWSLYGDCSARGKTARQMVLLDVLDLRAMQEDLKTATEENVKKQDDLLSKSELVDENGQYRKEITDKAYLDALRALLRYPEKYMTTIGIELELSYGDEGWRIVTDDQLLYALSGCSASERGGNKG